MTDAANPVPIHAHAKRNDQSILLFLVLALAIGAYRRVAGNQTDLATITEGPADNNVPAVVPPASIGRGPSPLATSDCGVYPAGVLGQGVPQSGFDNESLRQDHR